ARSREWPPRRRAANRRSCPVCARRSLHRPAVCARATCRPCRAAGSQARTPFLGPANRARSESGAVAERYGFRDSRRGPCVPFSASHFLGSFWGVSVDGQQCIMVDGKRKKCPQCRCFLLVACVPPGYVSPHLVLGSFWGINGVQKASSL